MSADSTLEKALNRLLWKMPKPPWCETAEDVAQWIIAELADIETNLRWDAEEGRIVRVQRGFRR